MKWKRQTLSFVFLLLEALFFGDFLRLDLKLPFRGSFTIQDGGTTMLQCTPAKNTNKVCLTQILTFRRRLIPRTIDRRVRKWNSNICNIKAFLFVVLKLNLNRYTFHFKTLWIAHMFEWIDAWIIINQSFKATFSFLFSTARVLRKAIVKVYKSDPALPSVVNQSFSITSMPTQV